MIAPGPIDAEQVRMLEELLDEEASLLALRHSQLDSLYEAILERDEDALERICRQMEQAQQLQAATDRKAQALRGALAGRLGVEGERLRLSSVIAALPQARQRALGAKRQRVIELAERFALLHMRTVVLLSECARVNRLLLESLFPRCQSVTTYSAAGAHTWQGEAGLMDMES